jgi:hypothetical protein
MCDLRVNHNISAPTHIFETEHLLSSDSYYYELLLSCLDAQFLPYTDYVVSRNSHVAYLWDVRATRFPV